jgi:hypothetical protein
MPSRLTFLLVIGFASSEAANSNMYRHHKSNVAWPSRRGLVRLVTP